MSEHNADGRVSRRRMLRNTAIVGGSAAFATPVIQSVTVSAAASGHTGDEEDPGTVVSNTSDLEIWLRADAGVTTESGGVSRWEDQAGGDHNATQGTATARPTLLASAVNGLPAVRFDGNDDFLSVPFDLNPHTTSTAHPDVTVFAVFSSETNAASPLRKLYSHDTGGYDRSVGLDSRAGTTNYGYFKGSGVAPYFELAENTSYVTADQWTPSTFSGWRNGVQQVSSAPVSNGEGAMWMALGRNGQLGGEHWQGWLAEFILYARILSDSERQLVENYLLTKYAIS